MTIHYENTGEDALNFYACWLRDTRTGQFYLRRVRIVRAVCMALLGILIPLSLSLVLSSGFSLLAALSLALLMGVIGYVTGNIDFKRMVRRLTQQQLRTGSLAVFLGRKEVTVTPEGLRIIWADGEVLRKWSALQRVDENSTHLMLFFGESDFNAIPKRAFRDTAHQQEFQTAIERFRSGAGVAAIGAVGESSGVSSPGAPWWRNRSAVDANEEKAPLQQRRP